MCDCVCVEVRDLEEQPCLLLVIFQLMRGHSGGEEVPWDGCSQLALCVCVCVCPLCSTVHVCFEAVGGGFLRNRDVGVMRGATGGGLGGRHLARG